MFGIFPIPCAAEFETTLLLRCAKLYNSDRLLAAKTHLHYSRDGHKLRRKQQAGVAKFLIVKSKCRTDQSVEFVEDVGDFDSGFSSGFEGRA